MDYSMMNGAGGSGMMFFSWIPFGHCELPTSCTNFAIGDARLELATSSSQTMRATNCANPRYIRF